jgi:cyclophilin family peptidyl-prolyl cis-trans isomerase
MLDGYNVVFGELVEGDDVLSQIEKSLTRQGTFTSEIKIESAGTR